MPTPTYGQGFFLGGGGDKYSTLPPPVSVLTADGGNAEVTVSFETLDSSQDAYLGDIAYILVLKDGATPESPTDGATVRFDKTGNEIV